MNKQHERCNDGTNYGFYRCNESEHAMAESIEAEKEFVPLAPVGTTPYNHSVRLHHGSLALHWEQCNEHGDVEKRVQTFTRDETEVLMMFLYDNRSRIHLPMQEERENR